MTLFPLNKRSKDHEVNVLNSTHLSLKPRTTFWMRMTLSVIALSLSISRSISWWSYTEGQPLFSKTPHSNNWWQLHMHLIWKQPQIRVIEKNDNFHCVKMISYSINLRLFYFHWHQLFPKVSSFPGRKMCGLPYLHPHVPPPPTSCHSFLSSPSGSPDCPRCSDYLMTVTWNQTVETNQMQKYNSPTITGCKTNHWV